MDLAELKELQKAIAIHNDLREPTQNDIDEHYCLTTGEVRFFNAAKNSILDLIGRVEAGEAFIKAFRQADLHCDVLGYIAGDYNDDPVDGEGIAMADELRKLLSQKG